jgi:hypothetical protein
MIIHLPELIAEKGEIKISARVETSKPIPHFPDTLWFSFPETYQPYITPRSEAFLLAMLVPAMYFNEDIEVRGTTSPKLAFNLQDFIAIYHYAFGLHRVDFSAAELKTFEPERNPEGVLLFFSGGVDSMFSLHMNLPENQPIKEARVTHGLLLHGFNEFDIALKDVDYFNRVYARYKKLFDDLGLELLIGKTNAYEFSKFRIDWSIGHIPVLVAFGYLLSNLVKVIYRASDGDYVQKKIFDPWFTSNYLLSCESIEIVSHTASMNRVEKLEVLSQWPPAHDNLRVCLAWDKTGVDLNCCKCFKCLATMILLDIVGVYEKFTTFKQPYLKINLMKFFFQPFMGQIYLMHFIPYAKKYKKYATLLWAYLFYYPSILKNWLFMKIRDSLSDKHKYWIRERFFGKRNFDLLPSG